MKLKIAAVTASFVLAAGFTASGFAGGHPMYQGHDVTYNCDHQSKFCGYQVGTVPAGKCAMMPVKPQSEFCGYQIGTVPAGKCVWVYNK